MIKSQLVVINVQYSSDQFALCLIEADQNDSTPFGSHIINNNDKISINYGGFSMFIPDGW